MLWFLGKIKKVGYTSSTLELVRDILLIYQKKECSCGFYYKELIPCRHAIKFLTSIGSDPKHCCSDIDTVE